MMLSPAHRSLAEETVKVQYLNLPAVGRGEVVRLFLEDNQVPFHDDRIDMKDWPTLKAEVQRDGRNPAAHVPIVTIGGRVYTEHIATCRYIARRLGLYGQDAEADYYTDKIADAYVDWRNSWVKIFGLDDAGKAKRLAEEMPQHAQVFESFLGMREGPFFGGATFTFADAAVFQIMHDEIKFGATIAADKFPRLNAFYEAVKARPNVAAYLASPRRHE
eukprot:Unigene9361_Nuclearia_a/m.28571 Unigene9361_Nuclearia_a/g.28571  ORF Unigene9361_Nuclearia_a/g.28571 Unigene9361_Nuclearia_a/m.28571 type:complete len:218 (+) Unigene9361_Nuclearia_a:82-735(+)